MKNNNKYINRIVELMLSNKSNPQFISDIYVANEFNDGQKRVPLEVHGTALVAGEFKGLTFEAEQINNPKDSLQNKFCDQDHDLIDRGTVIEAVHDNGIIKYKAVIKDKELADDIYTGKVKKVSPTFDSKNIYKDGKTYAMNLTFKNLSFLKNDNPICSETKVHIE